MSLVHELRDADAARIERRQARFAQIEKVPAETDVRLIKTCSSLKDFISSAAETAGIPVAKTVLAEYRFAIPVCQLTQKICSGGVLIRYMSSKSRLTRCM